jgi:hypothetical protein
MADNESRKSGEAIQPGVETQAEPPSASGQQEEGNKFQQAISAWRST